MARPTDAEARMSETVRRCCTPCAWCRGKADRSAEGAIAIEDGVVIFLLRQVTPPQGELHAAVDLETDTSI